MSQSHKLPLFSKVLGYPVFRQSAAFALFARLVLILQAGMAYHVHAQDLLPQEEAFQFSAVMAAENRIRASWQIAEGYYMYRHKTDFEFTGNSLITARPELPPGTVKQDALFGDVEVYTSSFSVMIPISINDSPGFTLAAMGQGCNEPIGVCYPPMKREVDFVTDNNAVPAQDDGSAEPGPDAGDPSASNTADALRALLASSFKQRDFLDVDEAFKLRIEKTSATAVDAIFDIAEGYYLYKDKIVFSADNGEPPGQVDLPEGKLKRDEYFGEVRVFDKSFTAGIKLQDGPGGAVIHASYQGCATDGICYSPVYQSFDIGDLDAIPAAETRPPASFGGGTANPESAGGGQATASLLIGAFFAGILLTFTPCVLPMIPILSSIIAGQGSSLTRGKGGFLALIYVLGTSVTYAGMGALAGATGDQLQAYFQNIWAVAVLSGLLFVMALSMFGLFELQMPSAVQEKIRMKTRKWSGSAPLVFFLGLFSALIIGACVSPVLISVLGIVIKSGSPILGAKLMFVMALGMGVPLIILGIGAGHFIPRAGQWMKKVKQGFGVMLIALAIYFLGALPQIPILLLWGGFFIILGVFLGSARAAETSSPNWRKLGRGLGILLLIWGIAAAIGGLLGQRDVFRPLPAAIFISAPGGESNPAAGPLFTKVADLTELERHLETAREKNKNVLIDYYADWCVDCVHMEETTFSDPEVIETVQSNFIALQIDVTDPKDEYGKQLKRKFDVFGPPATLFLDKQNLQVSDKSFYGYMDSKSFLELIAEF